MKSKPYQLESTGDESVDRNLRKIAEAFDDIARTVNAGVIQAPINSQAGDYQITGESFVAYTGAGGHTFTLPKANTLGPGKALQIVVLNTGPGFVTLLGAGETVNGASGVFVGSGFVAVVTSDGKSKWKCTIPRYARDTAAGEGSGPADFVAFTASKDSTANTNARIFAYTVDYTGRNLPSNITGFSIACLETNLGTGAPDNTVFLVSVNNAEVFRIKAAKGGARAFSKTSGDNTVTGDQSVGGDFSSTGNAVIGGAGKTVGLYGAVGAPKAAAPTTLADVIAILQGINACA